VPYDKWGKWLLPLWLWIFLATAAVLVLAVAFQCGSFQNDPPKTRFFRRSGVFIPHACCALMADFQPIDSRVCSITPIIKVKKTDGHFAERFSAANEDKVTFLCSYRTY
jgi:hypothetical protein